MPAHTATDRPTTADVARERALLDQIRTLEDTKNQAAAHRPSSPCSSTSWSVPATLRPGPAAQQGRDVAGLIAYARRESPAKGSRLLGLAHALTEQPHTLAAMHAGVLSEWRATLISRETSCLSREDRALVDAEICAAQTRRDLPVRRVGRPTPDRGDPEGRHPPRPRRGRQPPGQSRGRAPRVDATRTRHHGPPLRPAARRPRRRRVGHPHPDRRPSPRRRRPPDPRPGHGRHPRGTHHRTEAGRRRTGRRQRRGLRPGPPRRWSRTRLAPGLRTHPRRHHRPRVPDRDPTALRPPATGALVAMESIARAFPTGLARFIELRDRTCRTP